MNARWLNDPRFNNIDEKKKKYLVRMLEQLEGKNMNSAMQVYMQTASEMKKEGLSLTPEEGALMTSYLLDNMTPQEKKKWVKISAYIRAKNKA